MRASFHTVASLGKQQSLTREGFLLCSGVPVARTGEMVYAPHELENLFPAGADGLVHVMRDEAEVFRDEFVASLNGKPVVDDHPGEDVNPDNWGDLAGGVMMNVRRGAGDLSDCLVADLLVTRRDQINAVRTGKRQVSLGYTADYEEVGPGRARQSNMLGNHIALVDAGRCGVRCAIGDHSKESIMFTQDNAPKSGIKALFASVRAALQVKDEAAAVAALNEAETLATSDRTDGNVVVNLTGRTADEQTEARFKAIETTLDSVVKSTDTIAKTLQSLDTAIKQKTTGDEEKEEKEKKEKETEDAAAEAEAGTAARTTTDSAPFGDAWQATVAAAEILVPGITLPTYDAKSPRKRTIDALCKLRRDALSFVNNTPDGRSVVEQVHGKPLTLDMMTCDAVRTLFNSVSAVKRASNTDALSAGFAPGITAAGAPVGMGGRVRSIADLNAYNAKHYNGDAR